MIVLPYNRIRANRLTTYQGKMPSIDVHITDIIKDGNTQILRIQISPNTFVKEFTNEISISLPLGIEDSIFRSLKSTAKFKILDVYAPKYLAIRYGSFLFTDGLDTLEYDLEQKIFKFNGLPLNNRQLPSKLFDIWIGSSGRSYINAKLKTSGTSPFLMEKDLYNAEKKAMQKKQNIDFMHKDELVFLSAKKVLELGLCKAITMGAYTYPVDGKIDMSLVKKYLLRFTTASRWTRMLVTESDISKYDLENTCLFLTFTDTKPEELVDHFSWSDFTMLGGPNSEMIGKVLKKVKNKRNRIYDVNPYSEKLRQTKEKNLHQYLVYVKQTMQLVNKKEQLIHEDNGSPLGNLRLDAELCFVTDYIPKKFKPYMDGDDALVTQGRNFLQAYLYDRNIKYSTQGFDKIQIEEEVTYVRDEIVSSIERNHVFSQSVETCRKYPLHIGDKIANLHGKKGIVCFHENKRAYAVLIKGKLFDIDIFSKDFVTETSKMEGLINLDLLLNKKTLRISSLEKKLLQVPLYRKGQLVVGNKIKKTEINIYPMMILRLSHLAKEKFGYSEHSLDLFTNSGEEIKRKGRYKIGRDEIVADNFGILLKERRQLLQAFVQKQPISCKVLDILLGYVNNNLGISDIV